MNDEVSVATTSNFLSGFRMYEEFISPTTFGGGEALLGRARLYDFMSGVDLLGIKE